MSMGFKNYDFRFTILDLGKRTANERKRTRMILRKRRAEGPERPARERALPTDAGSRTLTLPTCSFDFFEPCELDLDVVLHERDAARRRTVAF